MNTCSQDSHFVRVVNYLIEKLFNAHFIFLSNSFFYLYNIHKKIQFIF